MNDELLAYAADTRYEFYKQVFELLDNIKEPINELEKMDRINTQQDAINYTKSGTYIVGSVSPLGDLSFSINPSIHANSQAARTECKRLATINPGKLFIFVKLTGGELVPNTSVSI